MQTAAAEGTLVGQELWSALLRRKWWLCAAMVLGLGAGIGYCALAGPWYDSSAQLLVIKKRLDTAPITGPDQARAQEDYLATHMLIISSRRVLTDAIEKGKLSELKEFQEGEGLRTAALRWLSENTGHGGPELAPTDRAANKLSSLLTVSRDPPKPGMNPSSEIINLSFRGRVSPDCPKVLMAIISSYEEFLRENYRNTNAEMLELISQARNSVLKDLEAKQAAYQRFLESTPPLLPKGDKRTVQQDHLLKIGNQLSELRLRRIEVQAAMAMIDNALESGLSIHAVVDRVNAVLPKRDRAAFDPGNNNAVPGAAPRGPRLPLDEELMQLWLQEARLLAYRPVNHPDVLATRAQIEAVRGLLSPAGKDAVPEQRSRDRELARLKKAVLQQELQDINFTEKSLSKLIEAEQKEVSAGVLLEVQDEAHRKGIEQQRLLYDSIVHRLDEISSVKDFGGYNAQLIGAPLRGELALRKYLMVLAMGLAAGLMLGLGLAYLLELWSARTPRPVPTARERVVHVAQDTAAS